MPAIPPGWTPDSWRQKTDAQAVPYERPDALDRAVARLAALPPLVTSWEVESLKSAFADAQRGERLVLQGGDCAETLLDCRPDVISAKLKILLQMSLVLVIGARMPVVRVGRFAGQYAKPRSSPTEKRALPDGTEHELPSYFGDLVNRADFAPEARAADPELLLQGYHHAAMTLNFIRSLTDGGFANLHHPEYWDLAFLKNVSLSGDVRAQYAELQSELASALRFMEAVGERSIDQLTRVSFFTSHEGLNLPYESAQTRRVPRREGYYDLTTHMPWIGERTRQIDGAHVEHFRGVRNPVGVKLGPSATPDEVERLMEVLNPDDEPGKLALITRMGVGRVGDALPALLRTVKASGRRALFICDPMHGNTRIAASGKKTRRFDDILDEVRTTMDIHRAEGTVFGGVHFELTGDDVTECTGGAAGVTEDDLDVNYTTACDPRLNYAQAMEMAFSIARHLKAAR